MDLHNGRMAHCCQGLRLPLKTCLQTRGAAGDELDGDAAVDASFYALNFARHRATLAITYRFADPLELRIDNEYRVQRDNPLRSTSSETYLASLSFAWVPPSNSGLGVALAIDNLTDSDYQPFPGTPAMGRQFSLSASYAW